jgi:hypothetical protein
MTYYGGEDDLIDENNKLKDEVERLKATHTAIPEEALFTLEAALAALSISSLMFSGGATEGHKEAITAARAWLASTPVATDKAVPFPRITDKGVGIYRKYRVERLNDVTGKHEGCSYFVLDWTHDKFTQPAMIAYAQACEGEFPELARDIRDHLKRYFGTSPAATEKGDK